MQTDVLQRLSPKIGYMLNDVSNPDKYKENLIKLEIYYEEFNFVQVKETPAYPVGKGAIVASLLEIRNFLLWCQTYTIRQILMPTTM